MSERISVDFNSRTEDGDIIIPLATVATDGGRYRIGDVVTLYDEELEVQAKLEYLSAYNWWIGVPDWTTKHSIE